MRIQARHLQPGDQVGSKEKVLTVSAGRLTPPGKVQVLLEKDGRQRLATWGAYTQIGVKRDEKRA